MFNESCLTCSAVILSVALIFHQRRRQRLQQRTRKTKAIVRTEKRRQNLQTIQVMRDRLIVPSLQKCPLRRKMRRRLMAIPRNKAKKETEGQSKEPTKARSLRTNESKAETAQTEESREEGTVQRLYDRRSTL